MTYYRTLPRDLFNESKLLKCWGQLCLKIHDGQAPIGLTFDFVDSRINYFSVGQDEDGMLFIRNLWLQLDSEYLLTVGTQYNSKDNYPMICIDDNYPDNGERVFDEQGEFTEEFLAYIESLKG